MDNMKLERKRKMSIDDDAPSNDDQQRKTSPQQYELMRRIFTGDAKVRGNYGSVANLYDAIRKIDKTISYAQVKNFIENQTGQIFAKRFRYSTFPRSMPLRFAYETPKPRNSMSMDVMWLTDGGLWEFAIIGIDNFSNYGYVYPTKKNNAKQAVQALFEFINPKSNSGLPFKLRILYSDNGSEFIAKEFKQAVNTIGAKHYYLTGYGGRWKSRK